MRLKLEDIRPDGASSFRLLTPKLHDRFYWHYHPEYEIVYLEGSDGNRHIGEHTGRFEGSELAFIGPYIPHLNFDYGIQGAYQKVVVQLRDDFLGPGFFEAPEMADVKRLFDMARQGVVFHGETKRQVGQLLKQLTVERHFRQLMLLLEVFQELATSPDAQLLGVSPIEDSYNLREHQRLKAVHHFVGSHFQRKLEVAEVAALACLSPSAFCRFFKRMNGLTFTDYVNRHRVAHAQRLLVQGASVSEACFQSGFESLSYFNKTFKKLAGQNPMAYRVRG